MNNKELNESILYQMQKFAYIFEKYVFIWYFVTHKTLLCFILQNKIFVV